MVLISKNVIAKVPVKLEEMYHMTGQCIMTYLISQFDREGRNSVDQAREKGKKREKKRTTTSTTRRTTGRGRAGIFLTDWRFCSSSANRKIVVIGHTGPITVHYSRDIDLKKVTLPIMSPLRRRRTGCSGDPSSEMACEACSAKFNLFKRKKQCADCLRHFCSECVIKRLDKVFTCDSCGVLSRRPLVRNQIRQIRSKDLRQYLVAKKVSVKGCVEKEDLVHLLMLFANGTDPCSSTDYSTSAGTQNAAAEPLVYSSSNILENTPNVSTANDEPHEDTRAQAQPTRSEDVEMAEEPSESSHSSPIISVPVSDNESPEEGPTKSNNVEIQEVSETDNSPIEPNNTSEPVITEHEEISEASNEKKSDMVTEIPTWSDKVQLSDIKEMSELEYLSVKQLKNLLSTNRVDYKGCIERQELLNRVSRLWQEYKQSRQDVEKLSEEELCKICWDAPIECVILECGHMACCINCGKQMSECPICKQYVVRVVRFFKA